MVAGLLNPTLYLLGAAQVNGGAPVDHIVEGSSRTRLAPGSRRSRDTTSHRAGDAGRQCPPRRVPL